MKLEQDRNKRSVRATIFNAVVKLVESRPFNALIAHTLPAEEWALEQALLGYWKRRREFLSLTCYENNRRIFWQDNPVLPTDQNEKSGRNFHVDYFKQNFSHDEKPLHPANLTFSWADFCGFINPTALPVIRSVRNNGLYFFTFCLADRGGLAPEYAAFKRETGARGVDAVISFVQRNIPVAHRLIYVHPYVNQASPMLTFGISTVPFDDIPDARVDDLLFRFPCPMLAPLLGAKTFALAGRKAWLTKIRQKRC